MPLYTSLLAILHVRTALPLSSDCELSRAARSHLERTRWTRTRLPTLRARMRYLTASRLPPALRAIFHAHAPLPPTHLGSPQHALNTPPPLHHTRTRIFLPTAFPAPRTRCLSCLPPAQHTRRTPAHTAAHFRPLVACWAFRALHTSLSITLFFSPLCLLPHAFALHDIFHTRTRLGTTSSATLSLSWVWDLLYIFSSLSLSYLLLFFSFSPILHVSLTLGCSHMFCKLMYISLFSFFSRTLMPRVLALSLFYAPPYVLLLRVGVSSLFASLIYSSYTKLLASMDLSYTLIPSLSLYHYFA